MGEAQWRELAYAPTASTLGNCSRLLPIHGHMMRVFATEAWTDDIRNGYVPFVEAMRNICLAPFYILLVAILLLLIVELFLMLVEIALIKANLVRQNIFAKVPCTIASKELKESIASANTASSRGSLQKSASSPGDLRDMRTDTAAEGDIHWNTDKSKKVTLNVPNPMHRAQTYSEFGHGKSKRSSRKKNAKPASTMVEMQQKPPSGSRLLAVDTNARVTHHGGLQPGPETPPRPQRFFDQQTGRYYIQNPHTGAVEWEDEQHDTPPETQWKKTGLGSP